MPAGCIPASAGLSARRGRARGARSFAKDERGEVPVIAPGGLIAAETRPIPLEGGRVLPLSDALFAHDALCFLDCTSRSLVFHRRLRGVDHDGI